MILPIVLVVLGAVLLIWHKKLAEAWYRFQYPFYKSWFGGFLNVDSKWFRGLYTFAVIAAGILLWIGAYAMYFGPIII